MGMALLSSLLLSATMKESLRGVSSRAGPTQLGPAEERSAGTVLGGDSSAGKRAFRGGCGCHLLRRPSKRRVPYSASREACGPYRKGSCVGKADSSPPEARADGIQNLSQPALQCLKFKTNVSGTATCVKRRWTASVHQRLQPDRTQ